MYPANYNNNPFLLVGRSSISGYQNYLIHDNKNCWDAQTYDEVSRLVRYRSGQQILEWRKWNGDETVMDAGFQK